MSASHSRVRAKDLELHQRLVKVKRVTKVVKGGRNLTFTGLVVVGDGQGVVGHGLGKAKEVSTAVQKGANQARKQLINVPRRQQTIPHPVLGKFKGARVLLQPAAPGTGIIAGGGVRAVLESCGIQNVLAKSKGANTPHNVVQATLAALRQLRDPRTIAQLRGITLQQVFNG